MKKVVLEVHAACLNILVSSVYDAKPVHYMSMVTSQLLWKSIKKDVYNVDSGEVESLEFLRMNSIDKYNKEMGNVDFADQLRGNYWLDKNIKNRKWWLSVCFIVLVFFLQIRMSCIARYKSRITGKRRRIS